MADGHSGQAVRTDDSFRAADDSPADLAVDGYRVDSALDDYSLAEDCRAEAGQPVHSFPGARLLADSLQVDCRDDFRLAAMAPASQAEQ